MPMWLSLSIFPRSIDTLLSQSLVSLTSRYYPIPMISSVPCSLRGISYPLPPAHFSPSTRFSLYFLAVSPLETFSLNCIQNYT